MIFILSYSYILFYITIFLVFDNYFLVSLSAVEVLIIAVSISKPTAPLEITDFLTLI